MDLSLEDIRVSVSSTNSTETGGTMDDLRDEGGGIKDDRRLGGHGETLADLVADVNRFTCCALEIVNIFYSLTLPLLTRPE